MPAFELHDWCAWAPRLTTRQAWVQWAHRGEYPIHDGTEAVPDVSFLPPMQRRRMGLMTRMFFQVAQPLVGAGQSVPVVLASQHGDTRQTVELLAALSRDEGLSPTAFGLSVHNATIGLWSMQTGQMCGMVATASPGDGLEHAVLEACGLMAEGAAQVLVVCVEDRPASIYLPWMEDTPFPYAVALLIRPGQEVQMDLVSADGLLPEADAPVSPLASVRRLLAGEADWCCVAPQGRRKWRWRQ